LRARKATVKRTFSSKPAEVSQEENRDVSNFLTYRLPLRGVQSACGAFKAASRRSRFKVGTLRAFRGRLRRVGYMRESSVTYRY
jgi:hypothetical protein